MTEKERKNQEYLESILEPGGVTQQSSKKELVNDTYLPPSVDYMEVDISILPSYKFYKPGTRISIRAAKVSEIQAYSVVDDKNIVDITEKMNELLSRNVLFTHSDGKKGTYRDLKDQDRLFILFMIREMTFSGGQTLRKDVQCGECSHEFYIPFRSTAGQGGPATFELHETTEKINKFWNVEERCYELIHRDVAWRLGAPTIGIQEDFFNFIKKEIQNEKKPNMSFMKVVPFLLYDRNSITEEGIKAKLKEYAGMDDLTLFQGINTLINNMTFGIKGLVMKCPECGSEVHTEITFPGYASSFFEIPDILDNF
jgi:hypothetical protein